MDGSIRVHVWTGNQFLSKDIPITSIRQLTDRDSQLPLDPGIQTIIDTTDGSLFVSDSMKSLLDRLNDDLSHSSSESHGAETGKEIIPPTTLLSQSAPNNIDGWRRV